MVDTGGLVFDDDEKSLFLDQIRQQAAIALTEACAAVLVVDGQAGLNDLDDQIARFLRKEWLKQLPVFVAVNKCESTTSGDTQTAEFYKLGLGEPMPVSGIHGTGVAELLDEIKEHLYDADESDEDEAKEDFVNIAIVGRPNVGKSSLFNKLFGESRAIVSDVAGTTRDTLDAELVKTQEDGSERVYRFIDTAGIRRKGKVQYGSEFFMVNRALKVMFFMLRWLASTGVRFVLSRRQPSPDPRALRRTCPSSGDPALRRSAPSARCHDRHLRPGPDARRADLARWTRVRGTAEQMGRRGRQGRQDLPEVHRLRARYAPRGEMGSRGARVRAHGSAVPEDLRRHRRGYCKPPAES